MGRARKEHDASGVDDVAGRVRLAMSAPGDERAIYVRIAVSLAGEMSSGRIPGGVRLPSHRRFAEALGVNVTTVTRAMSFLKDRGLILAEVGRGTAVRGRSLDHLAPSFDLQEITPPIDLSVVKLHSPRYDAFVRDALGGLLRSDRLPALREYHPALGSPEMRATAARWFADWDVPATPDCVAVTAGAQHALLIALTSVSRPGDVVLAPRLVYQGLKAAARMLGLGLLPVETDEHGMLPASVEEQASRSRARALFVVPTVDNPTGTTLPLERRREIAAMAKRLSLAIIEDDIFRPLSPERIASFASLHPQGTFHISSMSKVIAPGCRCGFLGYPAPFHANVAAGVRASLWMADQLSLMVVRDLIATGLHRTIIAELAAELGRRHEVAERVLGPALGRSAPWSNTVWVKLASGRRSGEVTEALHADGVGVSPAHIFAVGRHADDGLRIYKGSASTTEEWERALGLIAHHAGARAILSAA